MHRSNSWAFIHCKLRCFEVETHFGEEHYIWDWGGPKSQRSSIHLRVQDWFFPLYLSRSSNVVRHMAASEFMENLSSEKNKEKQLSIGFYINSFIQNYLVLCFGFRMTGFYLFCVGLVEESFQNIRIVNWVKKGNSHKFIIQKVCAIRLSNSIAFHTDVQLTRFFVLKR